MKTLTAKADAKNVLGVFYFSFKWVVPYRSLLNPPLPPFSPGLPSLLCTSLPLRLFPYLLDYFIFIITSPLKKNKGSTMQDIFRLQSNEGKTASVTGIKSRSPCSCRTAQRCQ